jgi:hypothetical protein
MVAWFVALGVAYSAPSVNPKIREISAMACFIAALAFCFIKD